MIFRFVQDVGGLRWDDTQSSASTPHYYPGEDTYSGVGPIVQGDSISAFVPGTTAGKQSIKPPKDFNGSKKNLNATHENLPLTEPSPTIAKPTVPTKPVPHDRVSKPDIEKFSREQLNIVQSRLEELGAVPMPGRKSRNSQAQLESTQGCPSDTDDESLTGFGKRASIDNLEDGEAYLLIQKASDDDPLIQQMNVPSPKKEKVGEDSEMKQRYLPAAEKVSVKGKWDKVTKTVATSLAVKQGASAMLNARLGIEVPNIPGVTDNIDREEKLPNELNAGLFKREKDKRIKIRSKLHEALNPKPIAAPTAAEFAEATPYIMSDRAAVDADSESNTSSTATFTAQNEVTDYDLFDIETLPDISGLGLTLKRAAREAAATKHAAELAKAHKKASFKEKTQLIMDQARIKKLMEEKASMANVVAAKMLASSIERTQQEMTPAIFGSFGFSKREAATNNAEASLAVIMNGSMGKLASVQPQENDSVIPSGALGQVAKPAPVRVFDISLRKDDSSVNDRLAGLRARLKEAKRLRNTTQPQHMENLDERSSNIVSTCQIIQADMQSSHSNVKGGDGEAPSFPISADHAEILGAVEEEPRKKPSFKTVAFSVAAATNVPSELKLKELAQASSVGELQLSKQAHEKVMSGRNIEWSSQFEHPTTPFGNQTNEGIANDYIDALNETDHEAGTEDFE